MLQAIGIDSVESELDCYYDENLAYKRLWANMLNVVYKDLFKKKHRPAAIRYIRSKKRGEYGFPFKDLCEGLELDYGETRLYFINLATTLSRLSSGEPLT